MYSIKGDMMYSITNKLITPYEKLLLMLRYEHQLASSYMKLWIACRKTMLNNGQLKD